MVNHHPAKFGGHRDFGSGDMFLVVEEQDSTCLLTSAITTTTHGMSCSHTRNFRLKEHFPKNIFQYVQ